MFFKRRVESIDLSEVSRKITAYFFECAEEIGEKYPEEYGAMEYSEDIICEVFRHSLCLAFGLYSYASESALEGICTEFAEKFKIILKELKLGNVSIIAKQAILQAGMHQIIFATNKRRIKIETGDINDGVA